MFFQWTPPPGYSGRVVFRVVARHPGEEDGGAAPSDQLQPPTRDTWSTALPVTVTVVGEETYVENSTDMSAGTSETNTFPDDLPDHTEVNRSEAEEREEPYRRLEAQFGGWSPKKNMGNRKTPWLVIFVVTLFKYR